MRTLFLFLMIIIATGHGTVTTRSQQAIAEEFVQAAREGNCSRLAELDASNHLASRLLEEQALYDSAIAGHQCVVEFLLQNRPPQVPGTTIRSVLQRLIAENNRDALKTLNLPAARLWIHHALEALLPEINADIVKWMAKNGVLTSDIVESLFLRAVHRNDFNAEALFYGLLPDFRKKSAHDAALEWLSSSGTPPMIRYFLLNSSVFSARTIEDRVLLVLTAARMGLVPLLRVLLPLIAPNTVNFNVYNMQSEFQWPDQDYLRNILLLAIHESTVNDKIQAFDYLLTHQDTIRLCPLSILSDGVRLLAHNLQVQSRHPLLPTSFNLNHLTMEKSLLQAMQSKTWSPALILLFLVEWRQSTAISILLHSINAYAIPQAIMRLALSMACTRGEEIAVRRIYPHLSRETAAEATEECVANIVENEHWPLLEILLWDLGVPTESVTRNLRVSYLLEAANPQGKLMIESARAGNTQLVRKCFRSFVPTVFAHLALMEAAMNNHLEVCKFFIQRYHVAQLKSFHFLIASSIALAGGNPSLSEWLLGQLNDISMDGGRFPNAAQTVRPDWHIDIPDGSKIASAIMPQRRPSDYIMNHAAVNNAAVDRRDSGQSSWTIIDIK